MLSSIPSPSSDSLPIVGVRYYGVMIALGVLAGAWLARKRWRMRGHDPDELADVFVWAVPAGLIGARMYHVVTDYGSRYCGQPKCSGSLWPEAFLIWKGGLGIPGGLLLGVLVGLLAARAAKIDIPSGMDAVAPAIPLAQAIGRLGNWFNQELFGGPTTLPWGLKIDATHRPPEFAGSETFHPTFLYEGLWNVGLMLVLLRIDATRKLKPGKLFVGYVLGYFTGRLWVESLRIDEATHLFGFRVNTVLSVTMIVIGFVWFVRGGPFQNAEARAAALGVEPWEFASAPDDAGSERSEFAQHDVAERGPQDAGPGAEIGVAEPDEREAGVGVDPDEGA